MATSQPAADDADPKEYTAIDPHEAASTRARKKGTARTDTVERILQNGWIDGAVCGGRYTDDYKRDEARNYDKGPVTAQAVLDAMDRVSPKRCWVEERNDGRQVVTVYWDFQSYEISLDLRSVMFTFDLEDDSEDDSKDDEEPPEPNGTPGEVFETLSTGDMVIWDGKSKPLEVTAGYEEAKEMRDSELDIEPTICLKGPQGGEKMLQRSEKNPDAVSVSTWSLSGSPETVSGLRVVDDE
jgi:hypothetical protein